MEFSVAMTSVATREYAEKLAEDIVANNLAACVQIAEVLSIYKWGGNINKDTEFLLTIKGRSDLFPELREFVLAHHDYDVPELIKLDIADGSAMYLDWMRGQ